MNIKLNANDIFIDKKYHNKYWSKINISLVDNLTNTYTDDPLVISIQHCMEQYGNNNYYYYEKLIKNKNISLYVSPDENATIVCDNIYHSFDLSINTSSKYIKDPDEEERINAIGNIMVLDCNIDNNNYYTDFFTAPTDGYIIIDNNKKIFVPEGLKIAFNPCKDNKAEIFTDYIIIPIYNNSSALLSFQSLDKKQYTIFKLSYDFNIRSSISNIDKILTEMHPGINFTSVVRSDNDI